MNDKRIMIKLYKKDGKYWKYWEFWGNNNIYSIHFGRVGEKGELKEIKKTFFEELKIKNIIKQKRNNGYLEIPIEKFSKIILQFYFSRRPDTDIVFNLKKEWENYFNEFLGWTGNGFCDGFDYGNKKLNIFSFVLEIEVCKSDIIKKLSSSQKNNDYCLNFFEINNENINVLYSNCNDKNINI